MRYDRANEVIQEPFETLPFRHKTGLDESMKGSNFICDCIDFLH